MRRRGSSWRGCWPDGQRPRRSDYYYYDYYCFVSWAPLLLVDATFADCPSGLGKDKDDRRGCGIDFVRGANFAREGLLRAAIDRVEVGCIASQSGDDIVMVDQ
jgi:hypothetical protein